VLRAKGTDVDAVANNGMTALELAWCRAEVVQLLARHR
jgi:hypothetical protein